MSKNELLYDRAIAAINALFSDKSVSPSVTRQQLEAVQEELDTFIELLPSEDEEE